MGISQVWSSFRLPCKNKQMLAGCQTILKRKLDLFAITGVHTSTEGRPYLATTFYFQLADIYRGDIASFPDSLLVCVQYEPHGKWRGGG